MQGSSQGWLWSQQLGLYLGIFEQRLRFFSAEGQLIPTPEEAAEDAQKRNEALSAKLQELGVDPNKML
jgi:hypothetical protein